jgi:lysophospholipase L1-like esterase
MLFRATLLCSLLLAGVWLDRAAAQDVGEEPPQAPPVAAIVEAPRIVWEVKSRFRLFRHERDFDRQLAAHRSDGVLAAEERLERDGDGRGWARDLLGNLCLDAAGRIGESCVRDGRRETYLAPADHRIGAMLANAPADAACAWTFGDGDAAPRQITAPCEEEVKLAVRFGRPTVVKVEATLPDQSAQQAQTEILVRDLLIVGMGDSLASGEGNPDRPVALSDDGFCFRRFLGGDSTDYFRPGRAGFRGDKTCDTGTAKADSDWGLHVAGWLSPACHRSLYSYQTRTALALAIENPHLAVTYVPLGCTGATIADGLLGAQRAREIDCNGTSAPCSGTVPGQVAELRKLLAAAHRAADAVLLTVGGNDIFFSGLVAHVIIGQGTERSLFDHAGLIASVAGAQKALERELPADFARLRAALKPLVGGDLSRVVFVSYGNPGLVGGAPCPGGRDGFDIHPAFGVDAARMREVAQFVNDQFLPKLEALALCDSGVICKEPASDRMSFVAPHQRAFADHGFCARSDGDPAFDRECFSPTGNSFQDSLIAGTTDPLVCNREAGEFRPYASRSRWIRTANDSYFTAMTYPEGLPSTLQPSDIHDATWGVLSAVYGGALHPTAEGHAAMADAALPVVREVLGLPAPTQ